MTKVRETFIFCHYLIASFRIDYLYFSSFVTFLEFADVAKLCTGSFKLLFMNLNYDVDTFHWAKNCLINCIIPFILHLAIFLYHAISIFINWIIEILSRNFVIILYFSLPPSVWWISQRPFFRFNHSLGLYTCFRDLHWFDQLELLLVVLIVNRLHALKFNNFSIITK